MGSTDERMYRIACELSVLNDVDYILLHGSGHSPHV